MVNHHDLQLDQVNLADRKRIDLWEGDPEARFHVPTQGRNPLR
jgi:hypothetical protein